MPLFLGDEVFPAGEAEVPDGTAGLGELLVDESEDVWVGGRGGGGFEVRVDGSEEVLWLGIWLVGWGEKGGGGWRFTLSASSLGWLGGWVRLLVIEL